ncbi:hypothetical protein HYS54_03255, partial [Candidatus Micrarchaeota archaeon]|nr:hypothetical protein [Candidatus Micrarchaeota archaeon]
MELSLFPFRLLRQTATPLAIAAIPLLFILVASAAGSERPSFEQIKSVVDYNFGGNATFAASDLTQYNQIGANALIPLVRLAGVTKAVRANDFFQAFEDVSKLRVSKQLVSFIIVFITLFLGYACYAMVSRIVYNIKTGKPCGIGLEGINPQTLAISAIAAFVVMFISAFSLEGFELVFLLNFGVLFAIAIPAAAAGARFGESFFQSIQFFRFNLSGFVTLFLLSFGVAVAAQVGLLVIFLFPLSIVDPRVLPAMKVVLTLVGITFALYYQFA